MRDPRDMLLDIDHSGLHSEPGSRQWIITRRSLLLACLSDIRNNRITGNAVYDEIKCHGGWQHLVDLKGNPLKSFEQFCESPNGLGMRREEIERRLTAQQLAMADGVAASLELGRPEDAPRDERGRYLPSQSKGSDTTLGRGATYLIARLKRDHPDVAARLAAGEFPSARAAARAAGLPVDTPPLVLLRRAWKRASEEERRIFHQEIR